MNGDRRQDPEEVLEREFRADDGSFLLQVRVEFRWDRDAYSRLTDAMYRYAKSLDPEAPIPRWIASGFWFLEDFVGPHTSHPNFPRPEPPEYYERALARLRDLNYLLFLADSPYEGDTGFEPM